jgi:hypothetical protein
MMSMNQTIDATSPSENQTSELLIAWQRLQRIAPVLPVFSRLSALVVLMACLGATAIQAQVSTPIGGGVSPSGAFTQSIPIRPAPPACSPR